MTKVPQGGGSVGPNRGWDGVLDQIVAPTPTPFGMRRLGKKKREAVAVTCAFSVVSSTAMAKTFDVRREGKNLRIRISGGDMTVARLSRAFQVDPNSLYLKEDFGDMTFWPNDSGRFNVMHLEEGASLLVMGEEPHGTCTLTTPQVAEQHSGQLSQVFSYGGTGISSSKFIKGTALRWYQAEKWRHREGYSCGDDIQERKGTSFVPRARADLRYHQGRHS